jgi:phosphoserine phosphatase
MTADYDPLPSWQEGKIKSRIIEFIKQVTDENSQYFVAPEQRLATFDNDGTLMVEKPLLAQVAYFKRKLLNGEPLTNVSKLHRILSWCKDVLFDALNLLRFAFYFLRTGITTDEYRDSVARWIAIAKHPRFQQKYTELAYLPMIEVLAYFEAHGFKNYIVSGSSANFIRPWSQRVYRVSANRVIGSSLRTRLGKRNGELAVKLEPIPFSIENRAGKVLSIERRLAQRPIAAFGNSYGDVDMLRWARTEQQSLCVLIHHTDEKREYKYSPNTRFRWGKNTLTYAKELNWQVVDMKNDWRIIFSFEKDRN